jgi:2-keto-4-pentenoate hydratase
LLTATLETACAVDPDGFNACHCFSERIGPRRVSASSPLGRKLAEAFRSGAVLRIAEADRPGTADDAEAVQDAMLADLGHRSGSWKLGATNFTAQRNLNLGRFFSGLIPPERVLRAPASLDRHALKPAGIECEVIVRVGRDLPLRDAPYSPDEAMAAVETVHPGFEIPETRFSVLGAEGPFALLADNGAAGYAIVGEGRPIAELSGMLPCSARLLIDGAVVAEGDTGALVQPIPQLLADHVNRMGRRGYATRAGDFILTGSLTPYQPLAAAGEIVGDFGPLGRVTLSLTDG